MQAETGHSTFHKLDLRKIAPSERNIRVVQAFQSIHPGTIFVLIDNKDLVDIHEQFIHDFSENFRWRDLQKGPDVWSARIGKLNGMNFEV